jgi:cell division protein FtsI/penicillin-binding protein 2
MLTNAVDNGIAHAASIPGYSIAGKTGTAQIAGPVKVRVRVGLDASGRGIYQDSIRYQYINGWIDSSFIGIAPASDPQVVMLITIHRPGVDSHNQVAEGPATAFSQLGLQVFEYLAIPPDRILTEVARP